MTSARFRPMKGPSETLTENQLHDLKYPLLGSPKIDGIRAVVIDGVLMSNTMKPIPNLYLQERIKNLPSAEGLDGELVLRCEDYTDVFSRTMSAVMSRGGEPDVLFHVFDHIGDVNAPFDRRLEQARSIALRLQERTFLMPVNHDLLRSPEEVLDYEQWVRSLDYEGVMLRSAEGIYKTHARATFREGYIAKFKRFGHTEAVFLAAEEGTKNTNPMTRDERGLAKRSSAKAGKVPNGTLGRMIVRILESGEIIKVGPGILKKDEALDVFLHPKRYKGRIARIKYDLCTGGYDMLRKPVFDGWRDAADITPR